MAAVGMTKNLNIQVTDEQYEELKKAKDRHGLTWREVLFYAGEQLLEEPPGEVRPHVRDRDN